MRTPLNHLHLHVRDLASSVEFYKAHFGMTQTVDFGGLAFLSDGNGFDLALMADDDPAPMPAWFHFGSRLESREAVDDLHARLVEAGVEIVQPPSTEEYTWFRARDPDGYVLEFYYDPALDPPA